MIMNIPDINTLKPAQCREVVIKKNYPDFYKYLNDNYPVDITFSEKMYWYYNNISSRPVCPYCGNDVDFINVKSGYAIYCSKICSNKAPEKKQKVKTTCNEKFGGNAPSCSKEVRSKMETTMLERFGVKNCQQNKDVSTRTKNTIIDRYGGQGNGSKLLRDKYIKTCLNKYGVDNGSKSTEAREKLSIAKRKYTIENHDYIVDYIDDNNKLLCKCKCPHTDCNKCIEREFIIDSAVLANRISHGIEVCTKLLPFKPLTSSYEFAIANLLNEYNIEFETNRRDLISKELDIYIPSKNIAIEFNGIYHHSDERKPNNYHINKYNECKEKGIQLISIWEDLYVTKYNIIKSVLLSKLGIYENKIYARECKIVKVDSKTAYEFYDNNHIQGKCNASIHYALIYDNIIVSMMSFGKRSLGKECNIQWELIRYCTLCNICVVGGASKLFNNFIKEYSPDSITSWSSNDISDGSMYKMLGFEYIGSTSSYWYVSKQSLKRFHRATFSKLNLVKRGLIKENDNRTEREIANDMKFIRIFDTGQTKWIWKSHS